MGLSKMSRIFLIFLLAINLINPMIPMGLTDGYGEESDCLGQFVDDYENDDNVSVAVNVINNRTLNCMELNYSSEVPIFEDYNDFTEVDVVADRIIIQNNTWVEHLARLNEDTYLYYDYGADYFDDFTHDFDFEASYEVVGALGNPWTLSQTVVDDVLGIYNTADEKSLNFRLYRHTSSGNGIILFYFSGGGIVGDSDTVYGAIVSNTLYFIRIVKDGSSLVLGVYSTDALRDAGDGTDGDITNLGPLNLGSDLKFRYMFAVNTWNDGAGDYDHNYDVYNLDIGSVGGGFETEGYFTTEDYLNYTTGQSLTLLTNASLPVSTSIIAEFSEDNSTWLDNEGNVGGSNILAGFYSLDLRDLNYTDIFIRYNFTGPVDSTPRLYQSRLITTERPPIPTVDDYSIIFLAIGLIMCLAIYFLYSRLK